MRRALMAAASALALVGRALPARAAAYTFVPVTDAAAPAGSAIAAAGVNDSGQVLGYVGPYSVVNGDYIYYGSPPSYFIESGGLVTSTGDNGGYYGFASAINNSGQILTHSFTGNVDTTFIDSGLTNINSSANVILTTINPSGLTVDTSVSRGYGVLYRGFDGTGFNDLGQVVGTIQYIVGGLRGQNTEDTRSGLYSNGTLSEISAPNPYGSGNYYLPGSALFLGFIGQNAGATAINDAGQIVGSYGGTGGFLDTAGVFTPVNVPGANPGTTNPLAISNAGVIAGSYADATGTHGFVDNNGIYTTLYGSDISGKPLTGLDNTTITGINIAGDLVGDSNGGAFFATPAAVPVPEPGSATLLGASLAGLGFVLRRARPRAVRTR